MVRLAVFFLILVILVVIIVRYKNTAKVIEIHGKKKRGKDQIRRDMKRADTLLREEEYYLLIQVKDEFVFWVNDDTWGEREFHLTPNGRYSKSFTLPNRDKVKIVVVKGEIRIQQNGSEMPFPLEK